MIFKPGDREIGLTVLFNVLLAGITFFLMRGLTRFLRFTPDLAASSTLAVMIFNSANYGLPAIQLAFPGLDDSGRGRGVAIQVITITTVNILTFTLGVLIMGGWSEWKKGVSTILRLPVLYAILAAFLIRRFDIHLPDALLNPLKWTSDGMLPVALLTLGAQLGQGGVTLKSPKALWITVAARLLLGPLLAYGLLFLLGVQGLLAKVLFVSSAFPTAVVTVLFGIEYNKEPVFTADVVFVTTLLSALTVTGAISLSAYLF
jgi:predicted permease